ncbi:AcrR family transcriptional regulator [Thermocatellispora tengchongensis]|uniref:AcrR family transcriptional regulator n=1 Tax=Thermocatellispora tengchongensis TaxID=1073253 RepID=A0A840PIZ5_9ACTN|nr:TetR/AcrR family transcriptional regulator C-terminal domain-containing protein [Thermocatellispora tengchongensis]MBB5137883.1 AcrR family transcriptional regulator [Thermocatellispora tengchongensis]
MTRRATLKSPARGEARREAILAAAAQILESEGITAMSARRIAEQAHASKETIYAHFGGRRGLLEALVQRQSAETNRRLRSALDEPGGQPVRAVLEEAVRGLLTLLTGARSLALNRAAIAGVPGDRELADALYAAGRATTGPLFEALLAQAARDGELTCPDSVEAFGVLFGLAVRDAQITALLGAGKEWTQQAIQARAAHAVALFYRLYGSPERS